MIRLNHFNRTGSESQLRSNVPNPAQTETLGKFTIAKAELTGEHGDIIVVVIGIGGNSRDRHYPGFRIDPLECRCLQESHWLSFISMLLPLRWNAT